MNSSDLIRVARPFLHRHPGLKRSLQRADTAVSRWQHSLAERVPAIIRPQPRQLTVAVTAACNLRCLGCRYGRDFMLGERLPLPVMKQLLDDAKAGGVNRVRLYGGEPMLHPDLPEMVRHSIGLGMDTYLTSNGTLLEQRIDELYDAGLRWMTMGFYGVGDHYDGYTQREGHFDKMRRGLDKVRETYGDEFEIQLNFVLVRPTTNLRALQEAWEFAQAYNLFFHLDLYGYSMPFFTDGPNDEIPFTEADRPVIDEVTAELVRMKTEHGDRMPQSMTLVRSVPDWLLKGADMKVPCDAYELLWVGADGTVQLCDVTFELGNLHETRLRDLLFTKEHRTACRDAFKLDCPNCTCKSDSRVTKHAASVRLYGS